MLTTQMRRVGWRECPPEPVRRSWESRGGLWQVHYWNAAGGATDVIVAVVLRPDAEICRAEAEAAWLPVHPETLTYCPQGWGVVVPLVPDRWWRDDERDPVYVCGTPPNLWWHCTRTGTTVEIRGPDSHWIAPCIRPDVTPLRPTTLNAVGDASAKPDRSGC